MPESTFILLHLNPCKTCWVIYCCRNKCITSMHNDMSLLYWSCWFRSAKSASAFLSGSLGTLQWRSSFKFNAPNHAFPWQWFHDVSDIGLQKIIIANYISTRKEAGAARRLHLIFCSMILSQKTLYMLWVRFAWRITNHVCPCKSFIHLKSALKHTGIHWKNS